VALVIVPFAAAAVAVAAFAEAISLAVATFKLKMISGLVSEVGVNSCVPVPKPIWLASTRYLPPGSSGRRNVP
jgi:hypothetical protein